MLYNWDCSVVPNVTGAYSPASLEEPQLPSDWTVWRQELCFHFMALHGWTRLLQGVLALPFSTTALWANFKLWNKKERKDTHYLGGDKQNAWHYYSSISITIVHFFLRGSGVTCSILLSLILCFSVFWHALTNLTPVVPMCSIYFIQKMCFHLLCHLLAHFNCLEQLLYPEVSASH